MSDHDLSTLEGAVELARDAYQREAYALSSMYLCRASLNTRDRGVQAYVTSLLQHVEARRQEANHG